MKTLNDYMAMSYRMEIVEDKDEGGFVVRQWRVRWQMHWMQKKHGLKLH